MKSNITTSLSSHCYKHPCLNYESFKKSNNSSPLETKNNSYTEKYYFTTTKGKVFVLKKSKKKLSYDEYKLNMIRTRTS